MGAAVTVTAPNSIQYCTIYRTSDTYTLENNLGISMTFGISAFGDIEKERNNCREGSLLPFQARHKRPTKVEP